MKFTIGRVALVKMLEVIGRKDPSKTLRDKNVRLSACAPRVFVEGNGSTGGIEALVLEDGTCLVEQKTFVRLLKTYRPKKDITVEGAEGRITFATTTLDALEYSRTVTPPGQFQTFSVTDDWLSPSRSKTVETKKTKTSMVLPNASQAIVEPEKILEYLLNPEHRTGASKAIFFAKFGFGTERWEQLAAVLLAHGQTHRVSQVIETGFGPRYEVDGALKTPDGRAPLVRSVWQWDDGAVAPRLITAYPLEAR